MGRSGYYGYVERQQESRIDAEELRLRSRVQAIHTETGQSHGSRRMAEELPDEGFSVGDYKAHRLMHEVGVSGSPSARTTMASGTHADSSFTDVPWAAILTNSCSMEGIHAGLVGSGSEIMAFTHPIPSDHTSPRIK